ncbi:glycosyltransferase family 1 protein [Paludibaculum fermentans]|uniref:glycosyltransferase family 1 protein n=1 Tax=Paludibaculum fermentans TaxID=1473598 RepID=UPI003EB71C48
MIGLRYISLTGTSGYAQAARRYLLGLTALGVPVTWTPMVYGNSWGMEFEPFAGTSLGDPQLDPICNRDIPYDVVLLHTQPEYYPRLLALLPGKHIAAYTAWETERVPRSWRSHLAGIDSLIVPCRWNRDVIRAGGFRPPIEVVPHALLPGQAPAPLESGGSGPFVFYSINVWDDRKAIDRTLTAYCQAFTARDAVRFVLKTSERHVSLRVPFTGWWPFQTRDLAQRLLSRYPDPPPLTLLTQQLPETGIQDLHQQGDCYVSLCHAEGWGLGAFDAAASGRPVVMTGYGGQTEFLSPDLAWLVRYHMTAPPFRPLMNYEFGHRWAEPDVAQGAGFLRHVYENRNESRQKAHLLATRLCARYRNDRVAAELWDSLGRHL